ncbi:cobyric acid synthase CobQ [Hyphomonas polymorpha PS728]|uniref:Cobyric acid synthase n=1 Tax=Hyphomonas polymorpha PS728 TaxID=1280954 RepID=A0A062VLK1_9PROT|nr:cobyric acid synthase [Hyphomonas polymorpha]KCZ99020.1 cobyric acid synthase CobQ [Hyphomonas polymorpha PS728]
MGPRAIMIQGTGSDVGKSLLVAGLCRIARRQGLTVAPFKPQNMSNNAAATADGGEIGRAQALQARACGLDPETDFNPVLLKPQSDRTSQVIVHGRPSATLAAADYMARREGLRSAVLESFGRLTSRFDLVIVEGAGSPAEINLRGGDIANMGFARAAGVPVVLAGDIDRGGVIAAIVGTKTVIEAEDAAMIRAFLINKFRGDPSLFTPAMADIERMTGWAGLGIVPWLSAAARLPAEDAVVLGQMKSRGGGKIRIAAPMLSRIANFDDADPLRNEPNVDFLFVPPGQAIPRDTDVIILFGTKSTLADMAFLRAQGWDHDILAHARTGGRVLGICGGYQMLGQWLCDPEGADGPAGEMPGLGLLQTDTTMQGEKTVRPVTGQCARTGLAVSGYEIHAGLTRGPDGARPFLQLPDGPEGAVSPDGRIEGTYVHGLFAEDRFRSAWLEGVRAGASSEAAYGASVEAALDALADGLEAHMDVARFLALAEPPGWRG